jgi:hypothetical protein
MLFIVFMYGRMLSYFILDIYEYLNLSVNSCIYLGTGDESMAWVVCGGCYDVKKEDR